MTECVISIVTKSNDLVHVLPSVIHLLYVKRSKALPLLALLACPKKKTKKKNFLHPFKCKTWDTIGNLFKMEMCWYMILIFSPFTTHGTQHKSLIKARADQSILQ